MGQAHRDAAPHERTRGRSPEGPFEGFPANPVLSARSTPRPIQNTGHGDLVDTFDGGTALVLLGMRPLGGTVAFSPLGRETFVTDVAWVDDWPQPAPVELTPRAGGFEETFDFATDGLDDPGWLAVRALPTEVAAADGGRLVIPGDGNTLADTHPRFVGRRQRHHTSGTAVRLDVSAGTGGLAARYDEHSWYGLEARADGGGRTVRRAFGSFLRTLPATLRKRREIQRDRAVPAAELDSALVSEYPLPLPLVGRRHPDRSG